MAKAIDFVARSSSSFVNVFHVTKTKSIHVCVTAIVFGIINLCINNLLFSVSNILVQ